MGKKRQIKLGDSSQTRKKFTREVTGRSERAAAIVAQASVEEHVRATLYCALGIKHDDALVLKELIGDDETQGVLTFSYQIKLAYLLGTIGKDDLRDLGLLAKIRNKFAHSSNDRSFNSDPINNMCKELKAANACTTTDGTPLTMRERFLMSSFIIGKRLTEWCNTRLDERDKKEGIVTQSAPAKRGRRKKQR